MAYNYKIGEIKENARYTVSTVDKWDGSTKTEEMTGASLKSFTNGCAHLYDIHAEEITEEAPEEKKATRTAEEITADILAYFKENEEVFTDCIEELDSYNGYLGDDRWYDMDELPEIVDTSDPVELLNRAYFGDDLDDWHTDENGQKYYNSFNPNRDYFCFNGYGNFQSSNWKDYRDHMDNYAVEAMSENRNDIYSIDDNKTLSALFDELEEVEE